MAEIISVTIQTNQLPTKLVGNKIAKSKKYHNHVSQKT